MSRQNENNHTSMPHLGDQVMEWKSNLINFFTEDWSRLRPLIMQLEETSWNDEISADTFDSRSTATIKNQRPTDGIVNKPSVVPSPPSGDRLSDLANRIEQRLLPSHGVGK